MNILGSRTGENVGIIEFIREQVLPFQQQYNILPPRGTREQGFGKGSTRGYRFRDIGDPACLIPEGTSSQKTVALEIQASLGTGFEPGPQDWTSRREALLAGFNRKGPGARMLIMIDPSENDTLIKALSGRWHYPKDATGRILGTVAASKRVSGLYSHACDALGYGLARLFPAEESLRKEAGRAAPMTRATMPPRSWVGA